jgi:15-cis-phytoene synthase
MVAAPRFTLDAALKKACVESIRAGSKSFHAASLLLPARVRLPARALYAFCRASDDLVDDAPVPEIDSADKMPARAPSQILRERLDNVYNGKPGEASEDQVFARVAEVFAIPHSVPEALIEGFEWDEAGQLYQSFDDLCAYAARVASTVGIMMTLIMGSRDASVLARAADLGLAMQLTNIARDVGEDARRGRLYLPLDWMREAGLNGEDWLKHPAHDARLEGVVRRLLQAADVFYERALTGVGGLPLDCRAAIRSAAFIYREIGREIAKAKFNAIDSRAHTTKTRKIELIAYAAAMPFQFGPVSTVPTHAAAQFLVDAAALKAPPEPRGFDAKAGRLLEILALAEQRRRAADAELYGTAAFGSASTIPAE